MKILIVTPTFLPRVGGAEIGIHEIAKRLANKHEVVILSPKLEPEYNNFVNKEKYNVTYFDDICALENGNILNPFKKLISLLSISYIMNIRKIYNEFRPDIINFHYAIPNGMALLYSKLFYKVPTILSLVGRVDVYRPETNIFKKIYLNFVFRFADMILPITNWCLPINSFPKKVIPYGVTIDNKKNNKSAVKEIMKTHNISPKETVLFSLQRLDFVKRVDILILMMKVLLRTKPNTKLIIGGKGSEMKNLSALIAKHKLEKNIELVGFIPDEKLRDYFALSNIFVFHSTFETFGIVLAQALAAGKPIVTVDNTCIPEVVENGINGYLVPELDPVKFAKAVIKLMNDTEVASIMKRVNLNKAKVNYNWNNISRKYEDVFIKSMNNL